MEQGRAYYIASCYFTAKHPALSANILDYIQTRPEIEIVRCCIPNYRVKQNEERISDGTVRERWALLPISRTFVPGDTVISVCHNCINIVEEWRKGVSAVSLWELIDRDESFSFPDHSGLEAVVPDCWRTRDRPQEQAAVRSLLQKMGIKILEAPRHHEDADFCGCTLYRPQPEKNAKLAPKHYVELAEGKFLPHTEEEQARLMREYCAGLSSSTVICYCHYCLEGLLLGGANARHLAELLFPVI